MKKVKKLEMMKDSTFIQNVEKHHLIVCLDKAAIEISSTKSDNYINAFYNAIKNKDIEVKVSIYKK